MVHSCRRLIRCSAQWKWNTASKDRGGRARQKEEWLHWCSRIANKRKVRTGRCKNIANKCRKCCTTDCIAIVNKMWSQTSVLLHCCLGHLLMTSDF